MNLQSLWISQTFLNAFWKLLACVADAESSSSKIIIFVPLLADWQNGMILDWIVSTLPSVAQGMNNMSLSGLEFAKIKARVVFPIPCVPIREQFWMSLLSIYPLNLFFSFSSRQKCSSVRGLYRQTHNSSSEFELETLDWGDKISSSKSIIYNNLSQFFQEY